MKIYELFFIVILIIFSNFVTYYIVINDDFEVALQDLLSIFSAERLAISYQKVCQSEVINTLLR